MSVSKNLYVCPKCHSFYSSEVGKKPRACPSCNSSLDQVDFSYSDYSAMNDEQKNEFKNNYVKTHYAGHPTFRYLLVCVFLWAALMGITQSVFRLALGIQLGLIPIVALGILYGFVCKKINEKWTEKVNAKASK